MTKPEIIEKTRGYIKDRMAGEGTGHDWWHVVRVVNNALTIGKAEQADLFVVELAALLHDIADWKFHDGDEEIGPRMAREWLQGLDVDSQVTSEIEYIVRHLSFKGGTNTTPMRSLEGKVVQDADRLDALGAIGIARTFAFGGSKGREIHNPSKLPQNYGDFKAFQNHVGDGTTINHFYEKLLLIKEHMNTPTGKKLAEKRHKYLENFLKQFYAEWKGRA